MNAIQIIFLILGAVGLGYGLRALVRGEMEAYHKGDIRTYQGESVYYLAGGLILASLGLIAFMVLGLPVALALLMSVAFFAGQYFANRIEDTKQGTAPAKEKSKQS
jgi:hypothetical protein